MRRSFDWGLRNRVLFDEVVDDEEAERVALRTILERADQVAFVAKDGLEGSDR
ncbi:MAG TPA: hypothetical protein VLA09_02310 [Longimicrobiales bacterium]|nr:hypothetical protein [Longimicrobiales bacterium]